MAASGEQEYQRGYDTARALCLTVGVEVARERTPTTAGAAYQAGYDWALWDYCDANGLPASAVLKGLA